MGSSIYIPVPHNTVFGGKTKVLLDEQPCGLIVRIATKMLHHKNGIPTSFWLRASVIQKTVLAEQRYSLIVARVYSVSCIAPPPRNQSLAISQVCLSLEAYIEHLRLPSRTVRRASSMRWLLRIHHQTPGGRIQIGIIRCHPKVKVH